MSSNHTTRPWPKPAASAAIFRNGEVLLAERGKAPMAGIWSLPGGHVEAGETVRAAVLREICEETGVKAEIIGHLDVHDVIVPADGGSSVLQAHYVLNVFYGRWLAGEPQAASDCRTARFVALDDVGTYPLTTGTEAFIRRAHALLYHE